MRECGTTSPGWGWLPGAGPKPVHTYKRREGGGSLFLFLVCKCEHHTRLRCPRFWLFTVETGGMAGNSLHAVSQNRLFFFIFFLSRLSKCSLEQHINYSSPHSHRHMWASLCPINNTSNTSAPIIVPFGAAHHL